MIKLKYDQMHNTIIVEFVGKIDVQQGEDYISQIPNVIPTNKKEFDLLVDLSGVENMDPKMKGPIKKAMDLFNSYGVNKIIRVIPNPQHDIGLNIMSFFHYAKTVKTVTLQSRQKADQRLLQEKT